MPIHTRTNMKIDPEEQELEIQLPYDRDEVQRGLQVLCSPLEVHELRALGVERAGTVSGYFDSDHRDELIDACASISGDADGVYVTLNPVIPDVLSRSVNRTRCYAKHTTGDAEITHRRWLPLDFDPDRPSGISSTDKEHDAALAMARASRDFLVSLGFNADSLVLADSGNGAHLLCRIELSNDSESRDLVKACLDAAAAKFSNEYVKVDQSTYNAARIWKVPGTMARKGDHTDHRPHRLARMVEVPDEIVVSPLGMLQKLAALAPARAMEMPRATERAWSGKPFNLEAWLVEHQVPVLPPKPKDGGRVWVLPVCPWNAQHTNGSAFVMQLASGAIAARCHHNSCPGKSWHDLRRLYEPDRGARAISLPSSLAGAPAEVIAKYQAAVRSRNNN